ncbi:hypothetical protein [Bradyrhizobium sp.]|uniref:hypothetical protein n=1 Tax=Bradyrhizobium sp. TaxID=376 RepID=UPI003C7DB922
MLAAIAVVVHTALWAALAPLAASPIVDPFTIICHSETSAPAEQTPAPGPLMPAHACDHCNLCSAATPPLARDTVLAARFEPVRTLQVLRPINIARHNDVAADPKLARGPPAFA